MKKYKFKTTINCGGCIATVTPHLNAKEEIKSWEVDIDNPDKILTVETDTISPEEVGSLVQSLGFKAERLPD